MELYEKYWRFGRAYLVLVALAVVLGCMVRGTPGRWTPDNPYPAGSVGYDVSWPNCGARTPKDTSWGVVGATGGLSLHPAKCIAQEATWFKTVTLYANTGYPGRQLASRFAGAPKTCWAYDDHCLAYNYGYAEGTYAVAQATAQRLHTTVWWLDVETENSWDDNPLVNRASIQGTIDAIRHKTLFARVGIYSYPAQWDIITAKWRPALPVWAATGEKTYAAAAQACSANSFTNGPVWLAQYTSGLDRDLACPVQPLVHRTSD